MRFRWQRSDYNRQPLQCSPRGLTRFSVSSMCTSGRDTRPPAHCVLPGRWPITRRWSTARPGLATDPYVPNGLSLTGVKYGPAPTHRRCVGAVWYKRLAPIDDRVDRADRRSRNSFLRRQGGLLGDTQALSTSRCRKRHRPHPGNPPLTCGYGSAGSSCALLSADIRRCTA